VLVTGGHGSWAPGLTQHGVLETAQGPRHVSSRDLDACGSRQTFLYDRLTMK
jgi:hypothetical protein